MNQAQIKGRFEQVKGSAKKVWGDLTDDDFTKAQGSIEKLYGLIHEKYGDSKESIISKIERAQSQAKSASEVPEERPAKELSETNMGKMEAQLVQWGARLDELARKASDLGAEAKADYHKRLDELKEKYHTTQTKFGEFKSAGLGKWESFKSSLESAWHELEAAFKRIGNHTEDSANKKDTN